jgi:hypothetical protein
VRGEICTICCGTEREVTVDCPFECEYLQEARKRDKPVPWTEADIPHPDIKVSEKFVAEHEDLLVYLGQALFASAMEGQLTVDNDVHESLDALIRTYRTLQTGVVYETVPTNPIAAAVYRSVQAAVAQFRREEQEKTGMSRTRDADVLGLLVFLARVELDRNNGRKRGRAFLDSLRQFYTAEPESESSTSLIVP